MHRLARLVITIVATAVATTASFAAYAQGTVRIGGGGFDRTGVGDTSMFAPIDLTTMGRVSETRSASGAPGHRYWQNRADYDLHGTLDTATTTLAGEMTMRYTNNSPDTLAFLWMQTEQNYFQPNSLNGLIFPQDSRFGNRGFEGGYHFTRVEEVLAAQGAAARRVTLKMRGNETLTKLDLAQPLAPGKTATIEMAWTFKVPEHGADRMGRDGALYEIAQWYPRVAVYDDIRGWNLEPYLGQGEFYLEYGDFNLSVTVPAGYIVAATGSLQNPQDVLTPAQVARLAAAARTDTVMRVVTAAELASGAARPRKSGMLTWKFAARNVRDAVFAASPAYQWDATSYKGSMAFAYYRPSAADLWSEAADMSRMSIQEYSERWFPYPYPQISAVEGPISGMEYPMLAMETHNRNKYGLYNVVTHEIGHNWFPMIVGSNERVYMWQDEGFNTFINTFSESRRYPDRGSQAQRSDAYRDEVDSLMHANRDEPINLGADRIAPRLFGTSSYDKPSLGLQLLREEILGPAAFDDAFRTYIRRWAYKHPTPADFFRTMENVGGRRLDWFWREWYVENPHFDQAIASVEMGTQGDTTQVIVRYENRARGVLPIRARFTFSDKSTEEFDYPAEVWSTNTTDYVRRYTFTGKTPVRIELDPDKHLVDTDRANNVWVRPGITP